ncbi:hypothetical protein [Acinetobacter variabilis]|uniref:hypothetical protein n=1 Tax=Acinetobacter variabilis TaxID=70346 RepID=UPI003D786E2E
MENLLKILAVITPIIVPLAIAFLNSKYSVKRHPKEEFAEDVIIAEKFAAIHDSNVSHLVKDRLAQQLLETKKITYLEVAYFYQYSDMERWIAEYIRLKDKLKLVRDSNGKIIKIHHPYSRKKVASFTLGYVFFAIIGLLPFLFINTFIEIFESHMQSKQYLVIFNMFTWPILSILVALMFLHEGAKYKDAQRFVKKFETDAIKI